jgi:iron complex transport system substrate-binding protein
MPAIVGEKFGDVNKDGSIDIIDVVYLFKNRNLDYEVGDINCDGSINIIDVVYLFKHYDKMREPVVFANTLTIEPHWDDGYCYVEDAESKKFVILKEGAPNPNIPNANVVYAPLNSVVTGDQILLGTAHMTNDGNIVNSVKAMQYLSSTAPKYRAELPKLYENYQTGKILDAGKWSSPNYDNIVSANPDMIFIYKFKSTDAMAEKLDELDLTYARTGAYWEYTYMGKTEWIKFFAAFYGEQTYNNASDYFQDAWKARNNILRKMHNTNTYPKVAFFYWSSSKGPYVWGAHNFRPKWINEVKGEFIFNDMPGTSGSYLDKETFYERAMDSDVVILHTMGKNITTKEQLLELNPNFENFKAFKNGRFYVQPYDNSKLEVIDPAGIMRDYANAIHPEVFGEDVKYFKKIGP